MTPLEQIREGVTDFLTARGIPAVTAWPGAGRSHPSGTVVAVSVKECRTADSGLCDYLGEGYDPATETWNELYGKKLHLTLGLDLYCPGVMGGAGCQAVFHQLAEALQHGGPSGLKVTVVGRGQVSYQRESDLLHCPAWAECTAYLCGMADQTGAFTDFEVRGIKQ